MSEVLSQENAIVLAAAQKFVALGSEIAQRSLQGKESDDLEAHSTKILQYLTVYRKGSSLETKALEAILYALRDLSESNLFPTVDPIVGQSITYLIAGSPTTVDEVMQVQSNGSNLTLRDTINFYNLITAADDSGNGRINVKAGGAATENTTWTLGNFNLTVNASGSGDFGVTFGSDASYDLFYRTSGGVWGRLPFATVDGYVLTRVGGALEWAAPTGAGYDTIQSAGSGVTQRATFNVLGALQAVDNAGSLRTDISVKDAGITYAMIQNVTNARLLGNATGSAAAPSEISVSGPLALGSSTLSIAQAGASADGYLSTSDWNTFNNKLGTALTENYLFVGDGTNVAAAVPVSGDATLASTGAVTVVWANGYTTYDARYLTLSGGTLTGDLTLNADPTNSLHAATKNYVDSLITGISWKNEVVAATTADITLSGEQTIDDVLTSESRVLVKDQSDATENGIYLTNAGAWTRVSDADTGEEIAMATVLVAGGTTYEGTQWTCTNTSITLGSSNITFGQISGSGTYTNGVGLSLAGNTFSVTTNGIVNSLIRPSGALSVIGRSVNSSGDVADISAAVDGDVLRRSGTTLGFGTIGNASITGLAWSKISGTPTTLAGYGITDSVSTTLTSAYILVGNAGNVATGVAMSSEATIDNTGAVTLSNAAVIGKVLTGYTSGAGTVSATDTILQAIQKLNGNIGAISGLVGSTGSIDNSVLRANGTGGSTVQASPILIDDSANLTLGSVSLAGTSRGITILSSDTNCDFSITTQGTGAVKYFTNTETYVFSETNLSFSGNFNVVSSSDTYLHVTGGSATHILTANQSISDADSGDILIKTGDAGSGGAGDHNSGNIFVNAGSSQGAGVRGSMGLFVDSVSNWQSMEGGLFIGNIITEQSAAIADGGSIYFIDESASSILGIFTETASVNELLTPTYSILFKYNGELYKVPVEKQ